MAVIAGLGGVLFLFATIVGGIRLLLLARRTRELPEFVLGMGLFLMGGVSTPLGAVARLPLDLGPGVGAAFFVASCLIMTIGCGGFALFTQRVFRPEASWARYLSVGLPGMMLLAIVITGLGTGYDAARFEPDLGYSLFQLGTLLVIAWCGFEATRFASALKRRVKLGLADPVVANRVRLWGNAMIIATGMSFGTIGGQAAGINVMGTMLGLALVGCFGSIAAGALYLAFLPPKAYTRWITAAAV